MKSKFMLSLACSAAVFAAAGAASAPAETASPMDALQVVAKLEKASNLQPDRKIETMKSVYDMSMPMQMIKGKVTASFKQPGKYRVEMTVPGIPANIEIFDGEKGYSVTTGFGVKPKIGPELDSMRFQAKLADPGLKLMSVFETVELDSKKHTVNGVECLRLVCKPKAELNVPPMELFVDAEKYHLVRSIQTIQTGGGEVPSVTDYSGHREMNGLVVPTMQKTAMLGLVMEMKLTGQELNGELDDNLFVPTERVQ